MKGKSKNVSRGGEFEAYIQSLYEGLGFAVERNVKLNGQQVDLVVRKTLAGVGEIRFLIECKFLSSGKLSNQEVHNFVSYIQSCKERLSITGGVIVCNRDFSMDAKLACIDQKNVQLKRQIDLEKDLFDVSDILRHSVRAFEQQDVFTQYVALSGTLSDGARTSKKIADVLDFLERWSADANGGLVTILGDFGSGKTTLLQRLHYKIARAAVYSQQAIRTPIFITLRDRQKYRSLDAFVEASIQRQFETKIPSGLFWQQLRAGRFIVLLDGFDEISTHVTAERRAHLFFDLSPLLTTKSPALMSCRPSYFVSKSEFTNLMIHFEANSRRLVGSGSVSVKISDKMMHKYTDKPQYMELVRTPGQQIDLDILDDDKINEYLRNRKDEFDTPWEEVKKFLLSIYDLKDLMSRPILLSMIADTVIEALLSG